MYICGEIRQRSSAARKSFRIQVKTSITSTHVEEGATEQIDETLALKPEAHNHQQLNFAHPFSPDCCRSKRYDRFHGKYKISHGRASLTDA